MQNVLEKLAEQDSYFEHIAEKVSNIQLNQSHANGETKNVVLSLCKTLQQKYKILTYRILTDEEAKAVFMKLKEKYPQLAMIELVQLSSFEYDQYGSWYAKLLRLIRVRNVLNEKVVKAKATIIKINAHKAQAAKHEGAPAQSPRS